MLLKDNLAVYVNPENEARKTLYGKMGICTADQHNNEVRINFGPPHGELVIHVDDLDPYEGA